MQKQVSRNVNITEGALAPNILRFALPLIAANLLQRAFHAADIIVVGRFVGDDALAAVTSTASLITMLICVFTYLSMGANVAAAQAFGVGEPERVSSVVHTSILLAVIGGIGLSAVGAVFAPVLLRWISSPESLMSPSTLYMRIYFLGTPATMLYNFGAALLRAGGDTRRPTTYLTVAGVLNVVLNLIFVLAFHMSVAGVALATAITQWLSAALILRALMRETGLLHLDLRHLRMDGASVVRIVKIGLPAGVQGILMSLSNVMIQSSVNSLGEAVIAGSGAAADINTFVYMGMSGIYQACLTFTGQNLGARKLDRVDSTRRWCLLFETGMGAILGVLCSVFANSLLALYISSPEAIAAGRIRLLIETLTSFLIGVMDIYVGSLRAIGKSFSSMIISILCICGFRLVWIYTVFARYHTPEVLFLSYPVSWVLSSAGQATVLYFTRRRMFAELRAELAAQQEQEKEFTQIKE